MTAVEELQQATRIAGACRTCGRRPRILYDPGATWCECDCGSMAVPDWAPLAMAREFNHERCGCWAPDTAGPEVDHLELVFTPMPEEIPNYGD